MICIWYTHVFHTQNFVLITFVQKYQRQLTFLWARRWLQMPLRRKCPRLQQKPQDVLQTQSGTINSQKWAQIKHRRQVAGKEPLETSWACIGKQEKKKRQRDTLLIKTLREFQLDSNTLLNIDNLMHCDLMTGLYPVSFDFALLSLTVLTTSRNSVRESI